MDRTQTAPTENTGDEGLREKIDHLIKSTEGQPWEFKLDAIMALIRQDRRELLERLRRQYGLVRDTDTSEPSEWYQAVPLAAIDAELQHGAETGEA